MSTKSLYRDEIHKELSEIGKLGLGSPEYKVTADTIVKLTGSLVELEKLENERLEAENREREIDLKERQAYKEERTQKIELALKVLSIVAVTGVSVWGTLYTTNYEREDVMTYSAGKEHFRGLHRFKFW